MIITNCPRCGAMNATTTCTKCGWSQFNKSTVSTGARVVEWEEEMSERAEMECKRCGDNEDRIDGFCSNECKDKYSLEEALSKMSIRIAELEAMVERLIEAGEKMQALIGWSTGDEATKDWDALVKDWKEREQ